MPIIESAKIMTTSKKILFIGIGIIILEIGLLFFFVFSGLTGTPSKEAKSLTKCYYILRSIDDYYTKYEKYPAHIEDLDVLPNELVDAWGKKFLFRRYKEYIFLFSIVPDKSGQYIIAMWKPISNKEFLHDCYLYHSTDENFISKPELLLQ